MAKSKKRPIQLTLDDARRPKGIGGWRPGAGRPRGRKTITHDARPDFAARYPQHVTWRLVEGVKSLRRDHVMTVIRQAIRESHKPTFRVVEFSIQSNHLHFIVEAVGKTGLANGFRGLGRRLVRRLNARFERTGTLVASRYHARALRTPREVRNALRYVLLNARHHAGNRKLDRYWIDPCSSGAWFTGWTRPVYGEACEWARTPKPNADATTWLLTTGWWKQGGALAYDEVPG
jgi:REP element-mobilizing transposase RayT